VPNGTPARIATTDDVADNVFTVTPTQVLFNFTPRGYTAQPR
jgi:hypothetical protein